jgi:hypothetical protein
MDPDIHAPLLDETSVYGAAARNEKHFETNEGNCAMPVASITELSATSDKGFEDAIRQALLALPRHCGA